MPLLFPLVLAALGAILLSGAKVAKNVVTNLNEALRELEPGIFAKPGVNTSGVVPWTWDAMRKVRNVYGRFGVQMVVTSLKDSHEHKPGSRHNTGEAFDVRTKHVTEEVQRALADAIAKELGAVAVYPGYYHGKDADVISHPTAKEIESGVAVARHIHVEKEKG